MTYELAADADEELRIIGEWEARNRAADQRARAWTGTGLHSLAQIAARYPHIEPGAMLSLARSEVDPDSPAVREVARVAAIDYYQGWRGGREPGESDPLDAGAPFRRILPRFKLAPEREGNFRDVGQTSTGRIGNADTNKNRIVEAFSPAFDATPLERVVNGELSTAAFDQEGGPTWAEAVEAHNLMMEARQQLRDNGYGEVLDAEIERRRIDPNNVGGFGQRERPDWMSDEDWERVGPWLAAGAPRDESTPTDVSQDTKLWINSVATPSDPSVTETGPLAESIRSGAPVLDLTADALNAELVSNDRAGLGQDIGAAVTAGARAGFTVLSAPIQELTGAFRNTVANVRERGWASLLDPGQSGVNLESQSDLGVAVEQLVTTGEVDLGSGWFPGGTVVQERVKRETSRGLIRGEPITPGRWAADLVFGGTDPNGTGYDIASGLVDFGVQAFADPTNLVFAGQARNLRFADQFTGAGTLDNVVDDLAGGVQVPPARALADEAGLFGNHPIPDTDHGTLAAFLHSDRGNEIVGRIAAENDFQNLWRGTNRRLPPDLLLRMADETNPDAIRSTLFDALKLHGNQTFDYQPPNLLRSTWARAAEPDNTWLRRATSQVPEHRLDMTDPLRFLTGIEDYLVNARVPSERIGQRLRQAAEMQTPVGRVGVVEAALDDVAETLIARGIDEDAARAVTGWAREHAATDRLFNTGPAANSLPGQPTTPAYIDGVEWRPEAHLGSELAPDVMTLPNIREIKRMTSFLQRMGPLGITDEGRNIAISAAESSMGMWKKIVMLRPAYVIRQILGDEQFRLSIAGMPSIFRHPIQLLASVLTDARFTDDLLAAADEPNGLARVMRERARVQMAGQQNDALRHRVALDVWGRAARGTENYVEAWGRELGQLAGDDIAPLLAAGESVDDVVERLLTGDLVRIREERAFMRPFMDDAVALREYVQSVRDRLMLKAGETPTRAASEEILEAVANGGFLGYDGQRRWFWEPGRNAPHPEFHDLLAGYVDDFGPDYVKHEKTGNVAGVQGGKIDRAFQSFFSNVVGRVSNRLSRSPAYRQSFFESMADKIPMLDADAQRRALELADRWAGQPVSIGGVTFDVNSDLLHRIRSRAALGAGDVPWNDAYLYMTHDAAVRTLDVVGDFTTKGQTADALRILSPFGNAWRESLQTYARLIKRNPLVPYDVMKGYQGATEAGLFYTDQNGEMVFAYPMSGAIARAIPDWVPVVGDAPAFPLTGRVQGLTMGLEVMPSVGPVVQVPLAAALPDTPRWDWARNVLIPYGAEMNQTLFTPEWLERIGVGLTGSDNSMLRGIGFLFGGPEATSQYLTSVGDVMAYIISTRGDEYDLSTEAGVNELYQDARQGAASLWVLRGLAQAVAPSAPRPLPIFRSPGGGDEIGLFDPTDIDTIPIAAMTQRLAELRNEDFQTAGQRFLAEFGDNALLLLQGKTESEALNTPRDVVGDDWIRDHHNLVEAYPRIAGLFAPQGGDQAGIGTYFRAVEAGEIVPLEGDDRMFRAQDIMASMLYRQAAEAAEQAAADAGRESIPPEWRAALADYRLTLMEAYPGYLREGIQLRPIEQTLGALQEAMDNEPAFRESEAGVALAQYLATRTEAVERLRQANAQGIIPGRTLTSQAAAPYRQTLIDYGEALIETYPSFAVMWERVLYPELELSDEELDEIRGGG